MNEEWIIQLVPKLLLGNSYFYFLLVWIVVCIPIGDDGNEEKKDLGFSPKPFNYFLHHYIFKDYLKSLK
jgi:hypothetical protein